MCGIGGVIGQVEGINPDHTIFKESIDRRGPDDSGHVLLEEGFMVHTRLSILDTSQLNEQPFRLNNRYVLTFNGEIYNYKELADNHLQDVLLTTTGDTEVLYYLLIKFGVSKTCSMLKGMFAFAFYDKFKNTLDLARDPFGEKPLYYTLCSRGIAFSSTLAALMKSRKVNRMNKDIINDFLSFGFINGEESIINGIYRLEPGNILHWAVDAVTATQYFNRDVTNEGSFNENDIENLLLTSVHRQSISDVPLGSFLSGGIDSSLITAMLAQVTSGKVDTFTIGFDNKKFNEAHYARKISEYLGTNHHEEIIGETRLLEIVDILPEVYDEPFADSSQIPTILVSEVARKKVTVALSGDGGDELFGGYSRYIIGQSFDRWFRILTPIGRQIAAELINTIPTYLFQNMIRIILKKDFNGFEEKVERLKILLRASSSNKYYEFALRHWKENELKDANFQSPMLSRMDALASSGNFVEKMMLCDIFCYMQNDILVKVDRAAMYNSLETRAPFLDTDLFLAARSLKSEQKISQGKGKIILQNILGKYLPRHMFDRPKMGFGVPLADWLRGPLRPIFTDYLLYGEKYLNEYLNFSVIYTEWNRHLAGEDKAYKLWNVFILIQWCKHNKIHIDV